VKLALGQGFLEGLRGFHWEPVSLHLSVLCLLWQLHFQAGSPMWLKDSCHAFNLHLCRYKFNDRKAPTNELALSLVLVGYYIYGWKIIEMGGALHCLAISKLHNPPLERAGENWVLKWKVLWHITINAESHNDYFMGLKTQMNTSIVVTLCYSLTTHHPSPLLLVQHLSFLLRTQFSPALSRGGLCNLEMARQCSAPPISMIFQP